MLGCPVRLGCKILFALTFVLALPCRILANSERLVGLIPPKLLVPPTRIDNLLKDEKTKKSERCERTLGAIADQMSKEVPELIESLTIEIGAKSAKSKNRTEKQIERLQYYLEALAWSRNPSEGARASRANAEEILKSSGTKNNALATLASNLIVPLYSGDQSAFDKLKLLIQKKPTELVAGEANLILADFLFSKRDYQGSRPYYLAAIGHPTLPRFQSAQLRLAWTYLESELSSEASAILKSLLTKKTLLASESAVSSNSDSKSIAGKKNSKKNRGLAKDQFFLPSFDSSCVDILIRIYAEQGNIEQAVATLQSQGFKSRMPDLYFETGLAGAASEETYETSIFAFNKLVSEYKNDLRAEKAASLILDMNLKQNRFQSALKNAGAFVKAFASLQKMALLKESLLRTADEAYLQSSANQDKKLFELTDKLYDLSEKFTLSELERTRVALARADIAVKDQNNKLAANFFWRLSERPEETVFIVSQTNQKKINIHRFCLENAIAASRESSDTIFKKACLKLIDRYDDKSKVIATCDEILPKVFLAEKNTVAAKTALDRRISRYPGAPDALESMKTIFGLVEKSGSEQLILAKKYLAIKKYGDDKRFNAYLKTLQFDSELTATNKMNDPEAKVLKIYALADTFRDDSRSPSIVLEASKMASQLSLFDAASRGFSQILKLFPGSPEAEEATYKLAELSENKLALEEAARLYKQFTEKYPQRGAKIITANQKRCELMTVLESLDALSACESLAQYDKNLAKFAIERLIAKAYYEGRVDYLQTLVDNHYFKTFSLSPNEKINALYKIYIANKRIDRAAIQSAAQIKDIYSRHPSQVTDEALKNVAELYFRDILFTKSISDGINLEKSGGKIDNLVEAIAVKKRALDNLLFQFSKIVQIGSPNWSAASYYQMAESHDSFAQMLQNPPSIEGIKPSDVLARLAPQARALQDEALRLYEKALSTSWKFQIYNEFAVKAVDGQARLSKSNIRFKDWIESPVLINLDPTAGQVSEESTSAE